MFDHLVNEFAPVAAQKGLRVSVVPCSQNIWSDRVLVENILRNLIANALKYTKSGRVLVGCRRHGKDKIEIQILDTGNGISQDEQSKIFDEFYQVGVTPGTAKSGIGLGLSIVKRISKVLDLDLRLVSEVGRGSLFSITVPLARSSDVLDLDHGIEAPLSITANRSIVVIDDDEEVCNSLSVMLASANNQVVSALSVDRLDEQALLKFPQIKPDIIIADYRLADDKTGVEAIACLCEVYKASIPAIILTGDTAAGRLNEIAKSGYSILHKPVNGDELLLRIEDVLRQHGAEIGEQ
jgi:hypothetical protein